MNTRHPQWDAAVIGAGPAGLSGAIALGRSRRSVVVIDSGQPRNARADGVHNFLSRDGIPPRELTAIGRAEAASYGVEFIDAEAVSARKVADGFIVTAADGSEVSARRLLVTTGLVDVLPDIPGVAEMFGIDVLHCPFCHGWEVRDKAIGVVLTKEDPAVHQALMFRQLSDDVTVFLNGLEALTAEHEAQLKGRGIRIVTGTIAALESPGGALTGFRLQDGSFVAREVAIVMPRFVARSGVLEGLGLSAVEHPMGMGEYVPTGMAGMTDVDGVWAAGNVTDLMAQVVTSASAGLFAGAAINGDLVMEEARAAAERSGHP